MKLITAWGIGLVALPLSLFVIVVVLLPQSNAGLQRIDTVETWSESIGNFAFNQQTLATAIGTPIQTDAAKWSRVSVPIGIELGADVDLPEDAPKSRVWFRLSLPRSLLKTEAASGRLGLLGNRVMGGPWAVWVDGRLVQTNLHDWRIGWNVPMRVMLPVEVKQPEEVLISVIYPTAKAYALGSLYVGNADAVDKAWHERNLWHSGVAIATGSIALALALITLQLAIGRRKESVYGLLCANAVYWLVSGFQYTHDFTGQDVLSAWFGWAVDASVNWVVALGILFALELEQLSFSRLRVALVAYAVAATLLTMPLWHWNKSAMIAQHLVNVAVFVPCTLLLTWHAIRVRTRSSWMLALAFWTVVVLGTHDLLYLSSQTNPDHIHAFQISVIALFAVFVYLLNRRYLETLATAERHEEELRAKLDEQERQLTEQHKTLERLRIAAELREQRDAIMQDLHDRVGSSLTTVLHRVRSANVSADETALLLQELEDDLRAISQPGNSEPPTLNALLAAIRHRMQRRLDHGAIRLHWQVDPFLPDAPLTSDQAKNLRLILSEALANAIRHANAGTITVRAEFTEGVAKLRIEDDGKGFDASKADRGRGLVGMRDRAILLKANFGVNENAPGGTVVTLDFPLRHSA